MSERIKELALESGLAYERPDGRCWIDAGFVDADLERFAELVRQDECNKFWDALMSDLEHGVKSLNERASERFAKEYPALNGEFKKEQA